MRQPPYIKQEAVNGQNIQLNAGPAATPSPLGRVYLLSRQYVHFEKWPSKVRVIGARFKGGMVLARTLLNGIPEWQIYLARHTRRYAEYGERGASKQSASNKLLRKEKKRGVIICVPGQLTSHKCNRY